MTPNDLDILIHFATTRAPHPRMDSPAAQSSIEQFAAEGVITFDSDRIPSNGESSYLITNKGRAWLVRILQTPCPRQVWVDEQDRIIEI